MQAAGLAAGWSGAEPPPSWEGGWHSGPPSAPCRIHHPTLHTLHPSLLPPTMRPRTAAATLLLVALGAAAAAPAPSAPRRALAVLAASRDGGAGGRYGAFFSSLRESGWEVDVQPASGSGASLGDGWGTWNYELAVIAPGDVDGPSRANGGGERGGGGLGWARHARARNSRVETAASCSPVYGPLPTGSGRGARPMAGPPDRPRRRAHDRRSPPRRPSPSIATLHPPQILRPLPGLGGLTADDVADFVDAGRAAVVVAPPTAAKPARRLAGLLGIDPEPADTWATDAVRNAGGDPRAVLARVVGPAVIIGDAAETVPAGSVPKQAAVLRGTRWSGFGGGGRGGPRRGGARWQVALDLTHSESHPLPATPCLPGTGFTIPLKAATAWPLAVGADTSFSAAPGKPNAPPPAGRSLVLVAAVQAG